MKIHNINIKLYHSFSHETWIDFKINLWVTLIIIDWSKKKKTLKHIMHGWKFLSFYEVVIFVKWNDVIRRLKLISGPIKRTKKIISLRVKCINFISNKWCCNILNPLHKQNCRNKQAPCFKVMKENPHDVDGDPYGLISHNK